MVKATITLPSLSTVRKHGMSVCYPLPRFCSLQQQDYWSKLDGNDIITWANAKLTRAGEAQAVKANQFWRSAIAEQNIPVPEQYYCSPLARCLETARISFASLRLPPDRSFVPLVKELFRENIGEHPCDRHSTKSWIQENYPGYILERGIREEDPLWTREMESYGQFVNRTKIVLDDVILHDKSTYISISAHTGLSRAALEGLFGVVVDMKLC